MRSGKVPLSNNALIATYVEWLLIVSQGRTVQLEWLLVVSKESTMQQVPDLVEARAGRLRAQGSLRAPLQSAGHQSSAV